MAWKYDGISSHALHVESETLFEIHCPGRNLQSPSDFELVPPNRLSKKWRPEDLQRLKEDFWPEMKKAWEQRHLRSTLADLIWRKLGGDNFQAAIVISRIAKRDVSARSIQAWLIDPLKRSSRTCPPWAVKALEEYEPPTQDAASEWPMPRGLQIMGNRSVMLAEARIEADESLQRKWAETDLSSLPVKLYELERHFLRWQNKLDEIEIAIMASLRDCKDFPDFRRRILDARESTSSISFAIDDARRAIEQKSDEFSNADGLPLKRSN